MLYALVRRLLFLLPPETAHHVTLRLLAVANRLGLLRLVVPRVPAAPVRAFGLDFPNPVGLAAGLDKNGEYIDALAALGFGFIEVGTVTPRPQAGNPQPRLFRLPAAQAVINRMGFNNDGVEALVANVRRSRFRGVLGINIGKNKDTPNERALDDYVTCLQRVYPLASYVTVNISSPNTPGLRSLQHGEPLRELVDGLCEERDRLAAQHGRRVPLLVKIAPDLRAEELADTARVLRRSAVDGVIATNTTLSRDGVTGLPNADETGGLSGAPLTNRSTQVLADLVRLLEGSKPVIGVGGICTGADAAAKHRAGAQLVQVYTGFLYRGPALLADVARAWGRG